MMLCHGPPVWERAPGNAWQAPRPVSMLGRNARPAPTRRSLVGQRRARHVSVRAASRDTEQPAVALKSQSQSAILVMLSGDEAAARRLRSEFVAAAVDADAATARFLVAVAMLLDHSAPVEESSLLAAEHLREFNNILRAVEHEWRIGEPAAEEKFKTLDEVAQERARRRFGGSAATVPPPPPPRDDPYALLGVPRDASKADIKAAYRRLALQLHPDVSDEPDATARFAAVVGAYSALTDGEQATNSDTMGPIDTWPEFQRMQKTASASRAARGQSPAVDAVEPQVGDLVEYPIPPSDPTYDPHGARTHGVGLLVSRNQDRGDVKRLSDSVRALVEVEPLRRSEPESKVWVHDELGVHAYLPITACRVVPRHCITYRRGTDHWVIAEALSPGCDGPPHVEEVML
jgi:DnaJ-domain-containing protein 1